MATFLIEDMRDVLVHELWLRQCSLEDIYVQLTSSRELLVLASHNIRSILTRQKDLVASPHVLAYCTKVLLERIDVPFFGVPVVGADGEMDWHSLLPILAALCKKSASLSDFLHTLLLWMPELPMDVSEASWEYIRTELHASSLNEAVFVNDVFFNKNNARRAVIPFWANDCIIKRTHYDRFGHIVGGEFVARVAALWKLIVPEDDHEVAWASIQKQDERRKFLDLLRPHFQGLYRVALLLGFKKETPEYIMELCNILRPFFTDFSVNGATVGYLNPRSQTKDGIIRYADFMVDERWINAGLPIILNKDPLYCQLLGWTNALFIRNVLDSDNQPLNDAEMVLLEQVAKMKTLTTADAFVLTQAPPTHIDGKRAEQYAYLRTLLGRKE